MDGKKEKINEISQDIKNLLEKKGFQFKPTGGSTLKTSTGMKSEKIRVEKEDSSFLITIQEVEKLPPG